MPRLSRSRDERREQLRERLWPGSSGWVWDPADMTVKGYRSLTRLLPWVLSLIRDLSGGKSGDPGMVYLELLCREMGQGLVEIDDEAGSAFAAGYDSERKLRTWRAHMRKLIELGFILAKKDGIHEFGKVLILHPLAVCARHHAAGRTTEEWWTSFVCRAAEIQAIIPDPEVVPVPGVATVV